MARNKHVHRVKFKWNDDSYNDKKLENYDTLFIKNVQWNKSWLVSNMELITFYQWVHALKRYFIAWIAIR